MLNICWSANSFVVLAKAILTKKIPSIISLLRKEDLRHCNYNRDNVPVIASKSFCFSELNMSISLKRNKCWRILKEIPATETWAFLCNFSADVLHLCHVFLRTTENYDWNKQIEVLVYRIIQVIWKKDLEVRMNTVAERWMNVCKQYLSSYSHW